MAVELEQDNVTTTQLLLGVSLSDMTAIDSKFEHEYLIKFKGLSYLHVQWLNAHEVGT
jgi:hypothetical protein